MKLPKISRKVRLAIVFFWAWGVWVTWNTADSGERLTWKLVISGFFVATGILLIHSIHVPSDMVAYVKLSKEEKLRQHLAQKGYHFQKTSGEKEVYSKSGSIFSPKVKVKRTPYNIQVNVPEHLLSQFDPFV